MPLTDAAARNATPQDKAYRLFDSAGLYLEVAKSGGRWWRLKYRFDGKEKRLSLGVYPAVSLKEARRRRDQARDQLAKGVDPAHQRRAEKTARTVRAADSFEAIAREWFGKFSVNWSDTHRARTLRAVEKDLLPWLGARPVAEITAPELLTVLRRIEARGAVETAHRVKQNCGQIFRYAIATGRAERDPAADLKSALPPAQKDHYPSIKDPQGVGALLRALDGYNGSFVVRCALRLAPLVFVRPGELRRAEWSEIDADGAEWRIPAERMTMRQL